MMVTQFNRVEEALNGMPEERGTDRRFTLYDPIGIIKAGRDKLQ